jgi:hypothetical protein
MKLSRALVIAADSTVVPPEGLRAIAQALVQQRRTSTKFTRTAEPAVSDEPPTAKALRNGADSRRTSLQATQASRNLLVRTIALLK